MNLAVAGLGFMGATHLKALQGSTTVRVAAVISGDEKKLAGDLSGVAGNLGDGGGAMDFSGVAKYRTLAEALADPGIDAIDLCLPTYLHKPSALAALKAGKHVLVEKPMALDGGECDQMIAAAVAAGRVLMVAQVLRFFPAYAKLIDAVRSGTLGRIHFAHFRRRCAAPGWGAWLPNKSQSGGGVFDLLIHDIDMALLLFGAPESITAIGHEDLGRGIDLMSSHWHYPNGESVEISGGWHHAGFPFSMDYSIVAEKGTVEYHLAAEKPMLYLSGAEPETWTAQSEIDGYRAEIEYFAECCRENRAPARCPPEDSANAVRMGLAMLEARKRQGDKLETT